MRSLTPGTYLCILHMFYIGMLSPPGKCQTHLPFKQLFRGKRASSRLGCDFHRDIQGWSQWLAVSQDCHLLRCFYCLLVSVRGHPLISKIPLSATFNRSFSPLAPVSPELCPSFVSSRPKKASVKNCREKWRCYKESSKSSFRRPMETTHPQFRSSYVTEFDPQTLGWSPKTLKGVLYLGGGFKMFQIFFMFTPI